MKEILFEGAEAIIYRENDKIIKERIRKSYRIPELDLKLRKTRTKTEAKLLNEARRIGVATPKILEVKEFSIVMEFISGKKVKEILNENDNGGRVDHNKWLGNINKLCNIASHLLCKGGLAPYKEFISFEIGKNVGKMHAYGIVHGDLTTSNMIFHKGEVYFIDFGLGFFSQRIEDFATDLSVLKESLKATHYKYLNNIWSKIIEGYKLANPKWKEVLQQLEKVETRGRYIKRIKRKNKVRKG